MTDAVHLRRRNKLWKTSFILPEHVIELQNLKQEDQKMPKSLLNEQELYELGLIAYDSLKNSLEVKVTYWADGFFKEILGIVDSIDHLLNRFKLSIGEEFMWIDVVKLQSLERI
ncbi:YolD-like family protein [Alkalihalobacillus trypoxylicola]|uniref:YolD-like family protein n=1 Tax=Alkalihalobacillus trypoxylicola TaxID=519424 RepID=A0A161QAU3_9BACI|nr:YolD-like family protein [Alkalihalobacillus trypoxylicola]KYG34967.1 hypothetical protein AZF04_01135 [Alkalihalobacillus trypoxylicola]